MSTHALSHLRVLDLTQHVAGPYCTKLLGDYGADVIKIEHPGVGESGRSMGPFPQDLPDAEKSGTFLFLNTNKRSVTLNLESATGQQILMDLAQNADIVVENFEPRVLPNLGLGYEDLSANNPGLIYTSISNFGQTGPYRDYQATEIVVDAMSGWMYGTGTPDREPIKPPGVQAQMIAGIFGLMGTLTAYYARSATGRGQHVDVSIMEAVLWMLMNITTTYSYSGHIWKRTGDRSAMNHPQGIYECKDGLIGANVLYYVEWERFCEFVGHPEWHDDPRFRTPADRARNAAAMDEVLIPWLRERGMMELYRSAQQHKLPFALVNSPADLLESPQLKAREYFVDVGHPAAGRITMPGAPFKMSETPSVVRLPAPLLGQHTEELLSGQLGYTPEDLVRFRERGIV